MVRGGPLGAIEEKLLVKFLALAQPDVADRDVALGVVVGLHGKARLLDRLPGQFDDSDGLAHVEEEDLATVGH